MTRQNPLRMDQVIAQAASGQMNRRDILKAGAALGLGASFMGALLGASSTMAQGTEVTLQFDAGATQGGGGKATADILSYCWALNGGSQFEFFRMVDVRLITLSADLNSVVGDIADTWDVKDTTATFKLRPGLKWHDGTPLTSKDVAFTINVLTDPATTSRFGPQFASVVGYSDIAGGAATPVPSPTSLKGVSTPDDETLVIELTQPDSGLLSAFYQISIMPEHLLGSADRTKLAEDPFWTQSHIGAGPFKLSKWVEGERIELVANPDYHLGAPQISKLNLLFFQSPETSLAAFKEGSSLVAPMAVSDLELVQGIEGAEIATTSAGVGSIQINVAQPEFSDKRVRQAIAYAIDKKTIADQVYQGYGPATATECPYIEWVQPADPIPYDYDPEKAKSLLAEVGWDSSKSFKFWYYYGDQITATAMEAIQQYLEAVGIKIDLQFDDGSGVRTQELNDGTWYLGFGGFGAQTGPANMSVIWGTAGKKIWGYSNPEFDAEMDAALRTYVQDEQAVHYQRAISILNEEVPWVPLFNRQNLIAVNTARLTTGTTPAWGPGHVMYVNHAFDWTATE